MGERSISGIHSASMPRLPQLTDVTREGSALKRKDTLGASLQEVSRTDGSRLKQKRDSAKPQRDGSVHPLTRKQSRTSGERINRPDCSSKRHPSFGPGPKLRRLLLKEIPRGARKRRISPLRLAIMGLRCALRRRKYSPQRMFRQRRNATLKGAGLHSCVLMWSGWGARQKTSSIRKPSLGSRVCVTTQITSKRHAHY